jgi:hypothetical protein
MCRRLDRIVLEGPRKPGYVAGALFDLWVCGFFVLGEEELARDEEERLSDYKICVADAIDASLSWCHMFGDNTEEALEMNTMVLP